MELGEPVGGFLEEEAHQVREMVGGADYVLLYGGGQVVEGDVVFGDFLDPEDGREGVAVKETESGEHVVLHETGGRQTHVEVDFVLIEEQVVFVEELYNVRC